MVDPLILLRRNLLAALLLAPLLGGCPAGEDKSDAPGDEGGGDEGGGGEGGGDSQGEHSGEVDSGGETGETGEPDSGGETGETGEPDSGDTAVSSTDCVDGLDGDGDGWVDAADPDCASGEAEIGYGSTDCNDGEDNEGDGAADAEDPGCADATDDAEGMTSSDCADGADGDGDGWTDAADPDCTYGSSELGYGGTECNDGEDNEGDGDIDGEDPGCEDATDDAEGYAASDCLDGTDDDGDGWVDAADPDCSSGTAELGYGSSVCNDGVDNEGDGDVDADDPGCSSATDDSEGATTTGGGGSLSCSEECDYDTVVGGDWYTCYTMSSATTYLMCMDRPTEGCPDADEVDVETLIDAECPTEPIVTWYLEDVCGPVDPCDTECCYAVTGVERYWGGRPFAVEGEARTAPAVAREDWSADIDVDCSALAPEARARLAALWLEMGLSEHASVASFARFSLHLLALGAPPELLLAASRAAADEVVHARLCLSVAAALGGEARGPGPLDPAGALAGGLDPARMVEAAILEGCVGETLSAAEAAAARDAALEPAIRRALDHIAEDERAHAALAWRFVRWALGAFPETRAVAAATFARALAAAEPLPAADPEATTLRAWGMLDARARAQLARRALTEVVAPCAEALLAGAAEGDQLWRATSRA